MPEALRRTAQLVRTRPRLLAPLVMASLATSALVLVQKAATHFLLHHWIVGHSFFGLYVPQPDATHAFVRTGMIVLLPFTLAVRILIVSIYLASFVRTVRNLRPTAAGRAATLRHLASLLKLQPVRVAIALLLTLLATLALTLLSMELGRQAFLLAPNAPSLQAYIVRPLLSLFVDLPLFPLWIYLAILLNTTGESIADSPAR